MTSRVCDPPSVQCHYWESSHAFGPSWNRRLFQRSSRSLLNVKLTLSKFVFIEKFKETTSYMCWSQSHRIRLAGMQNRKVGSHRLRDRLKMKECCFSPLCFENVIWIWRVCTVGDKLVDSQAEDSFKDDVKLFVLRNIYIGLSNVPLFKIDMISDFDSSWDEICVLLTYHSWPCSPDVVYRSSVMKLMPFGISL